jgi:hypothetical protein
MEIEMRVDGGKGKIEMDWTGLDWTGLFFAPVFATIFTMLPL